uniref:SCP domain-containing protein n=1 Tax=Strongyloides papillosus TaxID=174720 RepID=A0A0N5BV78_STREA
MDFLMHISEKHPELRDKVVIVEIIGQYDSRGRFFPDKQPQAYETCLPPLDELKSKLKMKKRNFKIPEDGLTITFSINDKISYKCNKNQVHELDEMVNCAMKNRHVKFGDSCETEFYLNEAPNCIKQRSVKKPSMKENFCEKPNGLHLFNLKNQKRKNSFSNRVWLSIWQTEISFGCYSRKNFSLLKERFMRELNAYRSHHKLRPLIEEFELTQEAQKRAYNILRLGRIVPDTNLMCEEVIGSSNILLAPFIIKRWYDTAVNKYNFHTTFLPKRSKNFVKVFLKSTTHIGMGVVKIGCRVVVVLKFRPTIRKILGNRGKIRMRGM